MLGWGWAIATIMANVVWCLPQFSLGTAAITQNLLPTLDTTLGKTIACLLILTIAIAVVWAYDRGSKGVKIFDGILKIMVGLVVVSFFGVVIKLGGSGQLDWPSILRGFVPNLSMLHEPAEVYEVFLSKAGDFRNFWEARIIGMQRDVMISAAATAVGINMTFFMPFVLLRRKWGRSHRGLAKFDLWTALLIPYVIATTCVVIAAGSRFNGKPESAYSNYEEKILHKNLQGQYSNLITERAKEELGFENFNQLAPIQQDQILAELPEADKQLAAMLVKRDSYNLADSLEGLFGNKAFSHYIFGLGVLGMAISTIIILMTINGHAVCEIMGKPHKGPTFIVGALIAGIGVIGPFVWSDTLFWLAVPTSILGFTLIPVAYLSFFLLINNKSILGRERPTGAKRIIGNAFMLLALLVMGSSAFYVAWNKSWGGFPVGQLVLITFGIMLLIGHFSLRNKKLANKIEGLEMRLNRMKEQISNPNKD